MEVLTQAQIDDLINSVNVGTSNETEDTEKTPENIDEYFHIFICIHCLKIMVYHKLGDEGKFFEKKPVYKWFSKHNFVSIDLVKNSVQRIRNEEAKKRVEKFITDIKTAVFKKYEKISPITIKEIAPTDKNLTLK